MKNRLKFLILSCTLFLFLSLAVAVPPTPPANPDNPEPASMFLLGSGGAALVLQRYRRRSQARKQNSKFPKKN